jgi:hypothetical protein
MRRNGEKEILNMYSNFVKRRERDKPREERKIENLKK